MKTTKILAIASLLLALINSTVFALTDDAPDGLTPPPRSVLFIGDIVSETLVSEVAPFMPYPVEVMTKSVAGIDEATLSQIHSNQAAVIVVSMQLDPLQLDEENIIPFLNISIIAKRNNRSLIIIDQLEIAEITGAIAIDTATCGSNWCAKEAILQAASKYYADHPATTPTATFVPTAIPTAIQTTVPPGSKVHMPIIVR